MSKSIKINCRKVYETGLSYDRASELVKENQKKLFQISSAIGNVWTGSDSNNFQVSFNQHIQSLDEIINFLTEKASILKGNALDHSTIDNNFSIKMKRSDIDE